MKWFLLLFVLGPCLQAGSFDSYSWRLGFLTGQGFYNLTVSIKYDFRSEGQFEPAVLALPNQDNLKLWKLLFKVDGEKAASIVVDQVTWWSFGQQVSTLLPAREGSRIQAEVIYVVKNLFLIPPAPTSLPVPVKKLNVGFAPVKGFDLSGSFIGDSYKFKSKQIAHRVGEASRLYGFSRKKVPASSKQGLLFLIAKNFTFSFDNLRATQLETKAPVSYGSTGSIGALLGGTGGFNAGHAGAGAQDTAAGHKGFSLDGDLKSYSANFYLGNPSRDWVFALTWLQQERTYLPFGIHPGDRVASRSLFKGAGDKTDDLLTWIDPPSKNVGDTASVAAAPSILPDINEATSLLDSVELFLEDFRKVQEIDHNMSRLVAYVNKQGQGSPAFANRAFANAITRTFNLKTVPALITLFPKDRIAALPLSAFDRVITGIKIGKTWFFTDAANSAWTLNHSTPFLQGHSVVILEEGNIQIGSF